MNAAFVANGQVTLVDELFSYSADGYAKPAAGAASAPQHWLAPFDYRGGRAQIRVEVLAKPNAHTPTSILCRLCSGPHKDRTQNLRLGVGVVIFSTLGVYRFSQPIASASPLVTPGAFRWDSPVTEIQVPVADADGRMVSQWEQDLGAFAGQLSDFLPLQVRYTAILVPGGATFEPPAFW